VGTARGASRLIIDIAGAPLPTPPCRHRERSDAIQGPRHESESLPSPPDRVRRTRRRAGWAIAPRSVAAARDDATAPCPSFQAVAPACTGRPARTERPSRANRRQWPGELGPGELGPRELGIAQPHSSHPEPLQGGAVGVRRRVRSTAAAHEDRVDQCLERLSSASVVRRSCSSNQCALSGRRDRDSK